MFFHPEAGEMKKEKKEKLAPKPENAEKKLKVQAKGQIVYVDETPKRESKRLDSSFYKPNAQAALNASEALLGLTDQEVTNALHVCLPNAFLFVGELLYAELPGHEHRVVPIGREAQREVSGGEVRHSHAPAQSPGSLVRCTSDTVLPPPWRTRSSGQAPPQPRLWEVSRTVTETFCKFHEDGLLYSLINWSRSL